MSAAGPGRTCRTAVTSRAPPARASPPVGRTWFGAGRVVAGGFGRPRSDEQAAGVPQARDGRLQVRVAQLHREVLGRVGVDEVDRGIEVRRDHGATVPLQRALEDRPARRAGADGGRRQHRPRRRGARDVVTRIAGESGPCSAWVSRSAATKSGFASASARTRPSEGPAGRSMPTSPASSSLAAVTQTLPGPTIRSTRSRRAVGRRAVEPERERRDRLRAAGDEHLVDAEEPRGAEHDRVDAIGTGGRRHDDPTHAGHLRRDDGHDERGGEWRLRRRHVAADAVEGAPAALDLDARHDLAWWRSPGAASRRSGGRWRRPARWRAGSPGRARRARRSVPPRPGSGGRPRGRRRTVR